MKTTIEISDPLLREARKLAEREGVTLRALVERGLRRVVDRDQAGRAVQAAPGQLQGQGAAGRRARRVVGAGCAIWPMKVAGLHRRRPIFVDVGEPNPLVPPFKPREPHGGLRGAGLSVVPLGLVLPSDQDRLARLRSIRFRARAGRRRRGGDAAHERPFGQGLARIATWTVGQTPCARTDRAGHSLLAAGPSGDSDHQRRHGADDGRSTHLRLSVRPFSRIARSVDVARCPWSGARFRWGRRRVLVAGRG